jgi:alkylhydroperoxidase family enzyme
MDSHQGLTTDYGCQGRNHRQEQEQQLHELDKALEAFYNSILERDSEDELDWIDKELESLRVVCLCGCNKCQNDF